MDAVIFHIIIFDGAVAKEPFNYFPTVKAAIPNYKFNLLKEKHRIKPTKCRLSINIKAIMKQTSPSVLYYV